MYIINGTLIAPMITIRTISKIVGFIVVLF
nr:MAG TPA: hypothetical protein [Caudoviricetes sp.]DAP19246.1 MAG TPA: hypothetical protein [Caudoviricetes sp.]DAX17745.1 MAG TPA: hypothetical protein [Caudoviricetes sp.]DAY25447.1 MAG TPA: hypothetical protein [Caudoviricetes sp.]